MLILSFAFLGWFIFLGLGYLPSSGPAVRTRVKVPVGELGKNLCFPAFLIVMGDNVSIDHPFLHHLTILSNRKLTPTFLFSLAIQIGRWQVPETREIRTLLTASWLVDDCHG